MPIYEYTCPQCGMDFELRRRFEEAEQAACCPGCGAESRKQMSICAAKIGYAIKVPGRGAKPLRAKKDERVSK